MMIPNSVKRAWTNREGPVVLATVNADGLPNIIYATCLSLYNDDCIVIADKQLQYDGSITLDKNLLKAAKMLPGEQVQVLNLNSGIRFVTYTIAVPAESGTLMLNGPAGRLGEAGDTVPVLSCGIYDDSEARQLDPVIVRIGESNQPMKKD